MKILPAQFAGQAIRRIYDEATDTCWFSVVDVVQVLTQQADFQTARKYWNQLKRRLDKEGSQSVTACHRLKLPAADGKQYLTDVATTPTLLRLVQSIPSPRAGPIKLWLTKVGHERMQEMADTALCAHAAKQGYVLCSKDDDFHRLVAARSYQPQLVYLALGNVSDDAVLAALMCRRASTRSSPGDSVRQFSVRPSCLPLRDVIVSITA